ncbi:hypothetical protein O0I10_003659 [Lichtheimia ornata]|uniref:Calcineurin-like phosphoesterase domain-containing protein n=1 Tax=Lichtheimia ornata TaxID=688661 RepID=A0AAD7VAL1_9FUNG|nr:uncharacterized protein O0I10_003659 [Lichtheimia ornata]KAJ8660611.1 hypothetical protein O0I10_003659 [Lichtheimia ornata]
MHWLVTLVALVIAVPAFAQHQQHTFAVHPNTNLHGRFLHITDIHLDPHYQNGATIKSGCHNQPKKHRKKKQRKGKLSGYWGAPTTDCDSSEPWVYHAIKTIADDWKDKIDFIVWTGDNARHDLDKKIPRTKEEILALNYKITTALQEEFRDENNKTIPIVPCIGNNDVHPHNQLRSTASSTLDAYSKLWSDMIPREQQEVFRQGGYFAVNILPGIRVLSLNTLYFFESNDQVLACKDPKSAGKRHLEWIREELTKARKMQARVYVIGHVPPSSRTFYGSCLTAYTQLSIEFRDVIAAHLYGHVNYDHFIVLQQEQQSQEENRIINIQKDSGRYITNLKHQYQQVNGNDQDKAVVVHVAPPILPIYYPGFRINEYDNDSKSTHFGTWTRYHQYYCNLTYWNNEKQHHALPRFELEYSTDEAYAMDNLTVGSWLDLAHRMTRKTDESRALWNTYVDNIFVQTEHDDD